MKNYTCLIWDLPTRIFHWLLTAGFIAAAAIAFLTEGRSRLFPYHAVIGLVLALMVVLRVIWGFIGTRHARFASFLFAPRAFMVYLKEAFVGGGTRHIGQNPGSAYAIFAMLALMLGISVTGVMLSRGKVAFKEAHEVMSFAMIAVVSIHVLGVIFHTIRHRENITLSLVTGRKACEPAQAIASACPIAAAVFIALLGMWTLGLVSNFDASAKTTTIPFSSIGLQLGEKENGEKQEKHLDRQGQKRDRD
jgi:cytochrome b